MNQQEVLPKVLADLRQRVEVQGAATYGRPMTTGDGRDSLVEAYEEALDLCCYLAKAIMERERFSPPARGLEALRVESVEGWAD